MPGSAIGFYSLSPTTATISISTLSLTTTTPNNSSNSFVLTIPGITNPLTPANYTYFWDVSISGITDTYGALSVVVSTGSVTFQLFRPTNNVNPTNLWPNGITVLSGATVIVVPILNS